jgi:hypothetical protein
LVLVTALPSAGVSARALDGLPLVDAGEHVDGLPLTAVLGQDGSGPFVSFVYGDCRPADDAGCAPPVEVQVWPACRRHLGLYGDAVGGVAARPERAVVRGAPAAFLDGGTRLELQTGRATVVVFAGSRARVARVAAALRAVDGSTGPGRPFPPPDPGALEGALSC